MEANEGADGEALEVAAADARMPSDPQSPAPPRAPYFDQSAGAWVLSRYAEVTAAFREARLWPIGQRGDDQFAVRDETGRLRVRGDLLDSISPARLAEWQPAMEELADSSAARLPRDRPVDLLGEYAKPWSLALAMLVTGADAADRERLAELGSRVYAGTGQPQDSPLRTAATEAAAQLERLFDAQVARLGEPTLVGVSQTMPRLLANGWLALLRHPEQWALLRDRPELMPLAIEELFRYASIVPALFRRAVEDVELGELRIRAGERVNLMVGSANRDPDQFPEPNRLDVTRRFTAHVTLGMGRNSCVGAILIRMAAGTTTGALLRRFGGAQLSGTVEWLTGSGFCWPAAVYAMAAGV
ncbi:MAG TPA: cytochrome P450 [Bryobacteraceae bacterium]